MRPSFAHQYPDLAACLTASAERPAGALLSAPRRAGGTTFLAQDRRP